MTDYSHINPSNTSIVIIHWPDILKVSNWNEEEEPDTVTVATVGWLLEDDPKWYKVAGTYSWEDECWSDIHTFPKLPPEMEVVRDQVGKIERGR